MTGRTVLRGGTVADGSARSNGTGGGLQRADVAVVGDRITAIGDIERVADDLEVDCTDRMILPGLIDAHSHADAAVFDPEVALALLRQGVTSVITGQDGVGFAPGDGRYATEYFQALNGRHPTYRGGGVAALLAGYDSRVAVNVGYLVPHGTVRHQVMGDADRPSTDAELERQVALVGAGLTDGALGLSTGLDYAPGYFADTAELSALAAPVGAQHALYVSHLRGGYEDNLLFGVRELTEIALAADVAVHISHLHGPAGLIGAGMDEAAAAGADVSFDAYPYRRGSSLLAMPLLPPALLRLGVAAAAQRLADPSCRADIVRDWLPQVIARPDLGPEWADGITLAGIAAPEYRWAEGSTVRAAAGLAGQSPAAFGLLLLARSQLAVSVVMRVPVQRPIDELASIFTSRAHIGSSDGIYQGGRPHPRGWGSFARYLGRHTRERHDYTWADAAVHLAGRTAARHGLGDRGQVRVGFVADLMVLDPDSVGDTADYDDPRRTAVGVDDVLVAGQWALRHGDLTGALPGGGLRRSAAVVPVAPRTARSAR